MHAKIFFSIALIISVWGFGSCLAMSARIDAQHTVKHMRFEE